MGYQFAAIVLSPILLAQGIYVRLVTPKFPEPSGVRAGAKWAGRSLRLLILGGSAAGGVGNDSQASALSGQLLSALSSQYYVMWRLMDNNGNRTLDVISHVESADPEIFDVAVVSVGVNDLTGGMSVKKWQDTLGRLCDLLRFKFGIQHVFLSSLPPMHAFPALPTLLRWYAGKRAASLNRAMKDLVAGREGCEFVETAFPLTKAFIANDGFHPSPAAYTMWAEQMAKIIRIKWQ